MKVRIDMKGVLRTLQGFYGHYMGAIDTTLGQMPWHLNHNVQTNGTGYPVLL